MSHGPLDDLVHITSALDPLGRHAVRIRELDEVGIAFEVRTREAVIEKQFLPLTNHAQVAIVDDQDLHRDLLKHGRGQLAEGHLEAAVANHAPRGFASRHRRADRGGETETHGACAARGQPVAVLGREVELGRPHLVLTDVSGDDAVAATELVKAVEHVLGAQATLLLVLQRVRLAPAGDVLPPVGRIAGGNQRQEIFDDQTGVAGHRHIGADDLIELGHVDVDVELDRVLAELRELAGDAIIPTRTDRKDQVAVFDRLIGVRGAVHAEHAQVDGQILGHGAFAKQGVDHRRLEFFSELLDRPSGTRDHRAIADVQQRTLALGEQRGGLLEQIRRAAARNPVTRQAHFVDERRRAWTLGDVLGQVDQDRTWTAGGGDVPSFLHDPRNVGGVLDQVAVLDHRVGDPGDVGFLEGVLAQHRGDGLSAQDDHRDRIHERGQAAGNGIGSTGA